MIISPELTAYQARRAALLADITATLAADERFVAAWLTGSYGRADADAVSDLDISVIIAAAHSTSLCARLAEVGGRTTPERYALFSQFGRPVVLHENNHNAPVGGTFTFILYAPSAIMVDWTLAPQHKAQRPWPSLVLFDRVGIPPAPPVEPELWDQRISKAAEICAFFWMMTAVTAKYLVRQDRVFVQNWLEELHGMAREVERLVVGQSWQYQRGSLSRFAPTRAEQKQAIYQLCARMQALQAATPELAEHGAPPESPLPVIEVLLNLVVGE